MMKRTRLTYSGPNTKPVAPAVAQKPTIRLGYHPTSPGKQKQRDIVKRAEQRDLEIFRNILTRFLGGIPDEIQRRFKGDPALCEKLFTEFCETLQPGEIEVIERVVLR